jgi:hypothetical protein
MNMPKIKPTVWPLFFARSPRDTARTAKERAPKGMENFVYYSSR